MLFVFFTLSYSLTKVIKNPISDHLPTGCTKIGTSFHADKCVNAREFAKEGPVVFVVGAMAHGKVYSSLLVSCGLAGVVSPLLLFLAGVC